MKRIQDLYDGLETIEIPIKSTSVKKFNLPDIPLLRDKIIKRIEVLVLTTTPNNKTYFSATNINSAFITFINSANKEEINRYPLFLLRNTSLSNIFMVTNDIFNLNLKDARKSYIEITNTTSLSTSESLVLFFYYQDRKNKNKILNKLLPLFIEQQNYKTKLVNISIENTSKTRFYFPNDSFLDSKKIMNIKLYSSGSNLYSTTVKTPDNLAVPASAIIEKSYITLYCKNGNIVKNMPISQLRQEFFNEYEYWFNELMIDWTRSFLSIANSTSLVANTIFQFVITYKD